MVAIRARALLAVVVAALQGLTLASAMATPAAGHAASRLPDVYQFMVGRDVPEAAGLLHALRDVAVAPDGTVYVLDGGSEHHEVAPRVLRTAHTGSLIGAWRVVGTSTSLAVDPDGVVLVLDTEGRRLRRYTAWGTFIGDLSLEEERVDSPCSTTEPVTSLTAGSDGRLYLSGGSGIQVRDVGARCITSWPTPDKPTDIAVDANGYVYAAYFRESRVDVHDSSGRRVRSFGRTGTGPGEFGECEVWTGPTSHFEPCGPSGLAIAPDGLLLAADHGNNRVQRLSPMGTYIEHWATRGIRDAEGPFKVAVGPSGTVHVTTRWQLLAFDPDGAALGARENGAPASRAYHGPRSLDVSPNGDVYVADTGGHRIQHLGPDGQFLGAWGRQGWGPGEMMYPQGVAVAPDGTVLVSDTRNRRLQRFDSEGTLEDVISPKVDGREVLSEPRGLSVARNGEVFVADAGRDRVFRLSETGDLIREYGGPGPAVARLLSPNDVALDEAESLWIADTGHERIVRVSLSGEVIGTWGTWGSQGSEPGQFDGPTGVAVAQDGSVIVADGGNSRLQRFSAASADPDEIEVLGSQGLGPGRFFFAADVAIGADDSIYVADAVWKGVYSRHNSARGRLVRLDADGAPLPSWGYGRPGDARFVAPSALAASADGTVYVGDSGNRRIQRLQARGELLDTFGEPGCGPGQMNDVSGLAVGETGNLFISDATFRRVTRFGADGALVRSWDPPFRAPIDFDYVVAVDVAPTGDVYVAEHQRVTRFDSEGRLLNTIVPDDGFGTSRGISPWDMIVAGDGTVITTSSAQPWLRRFSPTGELLSAWATPDDPAGRCGQPGMVAAVPDGSIYSVPFGIGTRIQHCDSDGRLLAEWGGEGLDPGRFQGIGAIAVARSGEVFVLDSYGDRVQVFTPAGTLVRWWDLPSSVVLGLDIDIAPDGSILLLDNYSVDPGMVYRMDEDGAVIGEWRVEKFGYGQASIAARSDGWVLGDQWRVMMYSNDGDLQRTWHTKLGGPEVFEKPMGVATSSGADGREILYVVDSGNGRVQAYDASDGHHLATLGREGTKPGELAQPTGLTVDHTGAVLVADTGNHRIQRFSPSGDLIALWGSEGSAEGEFDEPMGVAVTDDDTVLVADTGNRRVQAFTLEGNHIGSWSGTGDVRGAFRRPTAIAVAADGNVWVTDGDAQVLVFGTSSPEFWHARMYRDQSLIDGPVSVAAVDEVDFDWGLGSPAPGMPVDYFSVRVERPVGSLAGRHDAELTVFGGVTMSTRRDRPPHVLAGDPAIYRDTLQIDGSRNVIRLDYADLGGRAALRLDLDGGSVTWLPIGLLDRH